MTTASVYYTACAFCTRVRDAFINLFHFFIEAKVRKDAYETAEYLIQNNKDFRNLSVTELAERIVDENRPTHINGTPFKKER